MGSVKPSTTPRSVTKPGQTRSPMSKKKPAPNASILSFFKKVPPPEDSLFVDSALAVDTAENERDWHHDGDSLPDERYNEFQIPLKRRKLDDVQAAVGRPSPTRAQHEPPDTPNLTTEAVSIPPKPHPPSTGRRTKGPFIDDSDSDAESDVDGDAPLKKAPAVNSRASEAASAGSSPKDPPRQASPVPHQPVDQEDDPDGVFGDYPDDDMLFEEGEEFGEEDRERRFMAEQAKFEAADDAVDISCDDGISGEPEEDRTPAADCCPICAGSLDGMSPNEATVHVNSCLDGNPTSAPVISARAPPCSPPKPESPTCEPADVTDAVRVGKRFARAAIARPGQANPIMLDSGAQQGGASAFARLMSGHAEDSAWASAAAAEHSSRGKQAYERTCPFYKIMPGLSICVDAFRYGAVAGCKAYFLSHFHSDHYIGLTASWTHGPIYCSKVTGSLVRSQLRTAAKYVVELEFEQPFVVPNTDEVTVTMIPANHCPGSSLFLFEKAMGGSTGGRGVRMQRILHCGDFRACPAHVRHPRLRPDAAGNNESAPANGGNKTRIQQQKIDVCYLDTTYLNPRYSFPPQEDVIRACAHLCATLSRGLQEHDDSVWERVLRRREGATSGTDSVSRFFSSVSGSNGPHGPDQQRCRSDGKPPSALAALNPRSRLLVVCGTYSIGKERICSAIARALHTKIFATPAKRRVMAQLDDTELAALMTSNPAEAQVHMQSLAEIRAETLADYLSTYRAHFGRIVGFRPSGWNYRPAGTAANAAAQPSSVGTPILLHGGAWRPTCAARDLVPQRGSGKEAMCFGVPYSEHSSFRELAMFLMSLHIEKVVPTVNVGSDVSRKRMRGWIDKWLAERRKGGLLRILDEKPTDALSTKSEDRRENNQRDSAADADLWDGKNGRGGAVMW